MGRLKRGGWVRMLTLPFVGGDDSFDESPGMVAGQAPGVKGEVTAFLPLATGPAAKLGRCSDTILAD